MTWRPSPQPPEFCYCGNPIPADGPSDLYCSASCQSKWQAKGFDREPRPVRPEWRRTPCEGVCDCGPREVCMVCLGVGRRDVPDVAEWIETTDPAPVEEPLPPLPESCYPPEAVDLPVQYANAGPIRRIRNATRRNT